LLESAGFFSSPATRGPLSGRAIVLQKAGNPPNRHETCTSSRLCFPPATATFLLLQAVRALIGLRVDDEAEHAGLDVSEHGESAYNE
jgi:hypothetical protein